MSRLSCIAALLALSWPYLVHEDLHEQIAETTRRIEASPGDARLVLHRAELHRLHGEPELALRDVERAAALDPRCAGIERARGRALLDAGRPAEAEVALSRHLAHQPRDAEALFARARAREQLGALDLADADLSGALACTARPRPEDFAAHARVVARRGGEHVARAIAILDAGQARLGVNAALQSPAIELELARGNWDAALERLDALARQSQRQEHWLAQRADVLERAGRCEEAREQRRAALAAIERLPAKLRTTRAVLDLEAELRAKERR